jgi:hypothetical protein
MHLLHWVYPWLGGYAPPVALVAPFRCGFIAFGFKSTLFCLVVRIVEISAMRQIVIAILRAHAVRAGRALRGDAPAASVA